MNTICVQVNHLDHGCVLLHKLQPEMIYPPHIFEPETQEINTVTVFFIKRSANHVCPYSSKVSIFLHSFLMYFTLMLLYNLIFHVFFKYIYEDRQ